MTIINIASISIIVIVSVIYYHEELPFSLLSLDSSMNGADVGPASMHIDMKPTTFDFQTARSIQKS